MASHMTEKEYDAFKKKTGHREGQKVTTYYETNKKEEKALEHHAERREHNRQIKDAGSIPGRIEKAATGSANLTVGAGATVRKIERGVERIKQNPTVKKVGGFLKDRAVAIAHETQDIRPRGRGPNLHTTLGMGLPSNPDLFGVGQFGGVHRMMGADPFHEFSPRSQAPPRPAPQKKKRKRKTQHREPRQQGPQMMGGIPSHMKWMFGQ